MNRSRLAAALPRFVLAVVICLTTASGLGGAPALAQQVRPTVKGRKHTVKVDSSPQQAAVYWVGGGATNAKDYGIAGYTPISLKVPRGAVTFVVELQGWKAQTRSVDVKKSQNIMFTLERAPAVAKLDLQTSDGSATGANVNIDGVSKGTVPNVFELPAGRHQVDVTKQGFKEWSQWVDLKEGEYRTNDVALPRAEAPTGALLVTSDAGGDVYVDGVRKDVAPAIITGVPAGDHVIEVRKEGVAPWRQNVTVPSGQQVKVSAVFGPNVGTGSIRAIASEDGAQIFIDGEDKGKTPATANNVKPGDHIVEARKAKFKSVQQTVHVGQGDNAIVQLKMELAPPDRPKATLKVQSTVPNAEVFVDGSSLGRAPVDRNDMDPGKHYIVVHRDGYTDFKREVYLNENQAVALVADLSATGSVRVLSTPEGADVRIDGELVGKTPVTRDQIGSGDHVIEFRLKGYFDHKETIKVEGGREKVFSVDLKLIPTGPTPEQVAKRKGGMSSFGARVNPVGGVTADFGSGYPYYIMARLTVGAFNTKPLGLDLGVEFTSFVEMNNLSVHGRLQLVEAGPLSLAAKINAGGGAGFNGRDSYFADFIGIASLGFNDVATVSATLRWSMWTDKFCPSVTQQQNGIKPEAYCGTPGAGNYDKTIFWKDPNTNRFADDRLYLGLSVTAALDRYTSLFLQLEFLPAPDTFNYAVRPAYDSSYNGAMLGHDPFYYGQIGVSLKF
jgi:hypothetical protein